MACLCSQASLELDFGVCAQALSVKTSQVSSLITLPGGQLCYMQCENVTHIRLQCELTYISRETIKLTMHASGSKTKQELSTCRPRM